MFKSIKWKLVFMVVVVTVVVVLLTGLFFGVQVTNYFLEDFSVKMHSIMQGELGAQISQQSGDRPQDLWETIQKKADQLGLGETRSLYILYDNGDVFRDSEGRICAPMDDAVGNTPPPGGLTDNIKAAMEGREGNGVSVLSPITDYAKPVFDADGNVDSIIYILDGKQDLMRILHESSWMIGQALLLGIVIAVLAAYLIARTIAKPVRALTDKAKHIAEGDFDTEAKFSSRDEIGRLSQTLDQMAEELKNNLSEIEEEKNKLETVQTFMSDGVMAFDAAGTLIHINRAAAEMLSVPEAETLHFDDYFHSIGIQISIAELVFKSETVLRRYYEKAGRHIEMLFARMSKGEKTTGVITMLHDVTQQQKLDAARREFVANVSHELRTPITTIKSYTETVKETEDLPRDVQKRFLSVVEKEADRMTRLIHDLLTLSSLDNDKLNQKAEKFDLTLLIAEVIDKLNMDKKEGQKLKYTKISELPKFSGNPDRMEQVLTNVISNAIKYTPEEGQINVFSGHVYDYIYVKVQDTGIGIPKQSLNHVFERFYRADRARSRNEGGTGLGLAIAKEIVEEHGGSISITSEVSRGTEVLMKFPIAGA